MKKLRDNATALVEENVEGAYNLTKVMLFFEFLKKNENFSKFFNSFIQFLI